MVEYHPKRFGKYLLLDKIAIGGMAELYRAMITGVQGFEKLIAIKRILPHLVVEENLIKAFIDEAKLAALLHHQNIVQIYDFGSLESTYFIAMEYLFGKDLRLILKKAQDINNPLSLAHALYITAQAGSGLDYAHKLKDFNGTPITLIHRDISPPNILVTFEGNVKVVDFGIAKAATQRTMTEVGMIKGKVAYMSPEQAAGEVIDHRSDIFSCGILLYEMATGKKMFEGDTLHILANVREASFASPEQLNQELPPKLIEILHRALAKDPADRYQTMGDMVEDIEECLYQNSMRPTAHSLSDYLKGIFNEEIAKEESDVRTLIQLGTAKSEEAGSGTSLRKKHIASNIANAARRGYKKISTKFQEHSHSTSTTLRHALQKIRHTLRKTEKSEEQGESGKIGFLNQLKTPKALISIVGGLLLITGIVIALIPRNFPSPPQEEVEQGQEDPNNNLLTQGQSALQEGRFEEAVTLFEELLTNEPSFFEQLSIPYAQALAGHAKDSAQKNPEQAKEMLRKAADLNPKNSLIYFELGRIYLNAKDYPMAIENYEKAAELNPSFPDTFFNLGFIHQVNKENIKAEQMYKKVVSLNPPYLDEALFNLAVIQNIQGNKADCLVNLKKVIEVNPDNTLARQYLDQITK
jgi:serine/threonine protein kinase/Tfp pilus assembly protein PilF